MSFLSDVGAFFSGNSIASSVVKLIGLSFIAKQISSNITPDNAVSGTTNIDAGVRLQIPPATNNKIPVLYGTAFFGGIITDAVMTNTNKTMYYCLTLSERTGTKLSDNTSSTYTFKDIYWNDQRVIFKSDGITVDYTVDRGGNIDRNLDGQVKFYCYAGDSRSAKIPENYTNTNTSYAYTIMPNWTSSTHMMNELIFSICKVDYNREKNVTGIGDVKFHIANSMYLPGDVLNDYMINSRYGAGIDTAEVYKV